METFQQKYEKNFVRFLNKNFDILFFKSLTSKDFFDFLKLHRIFDVSHS